MLFPKKGLLFLFLTLLIFNFLILSFQTYSNIWYKAFSLVLSPLVKGTHNIIKFFLDLSYSIKEIKNSKLENKILKEKIIWQKIKMDKISLENLYLRQFYDFQSLPFNFELYKKAHIIKTDMAGFASKLIISAGGNKGVKENDVCISPEGVIGKIVKVEFFQSYLLPIVNPEGLISGVSERSGTHGVLRGDGSGFLELKYLPPYSDIQETDVILTDCWDRVFPPGLRIGFVVKVKRETEELKVKVQPSVDFSKLNFVFIIKGFEN